MTIIISVILVVIFLIPAFLAAYFCMERAAVKRKLKSREHTAYTPQVSVILPFKGYDYNFENTVKELLHQEYRGKYEVLFVTSDTSSEAIDIIHKYIKDCPFARLIQLKLPDNSVCKNDKINNSLNGVLQAAASSEVYLFLDSDIIVHKHWIQKMVQPLQFNEHGLSTGSAWIHSEDNSIFCRVARFWDFIATTYVTFPPTSFARGFSFGIRKEVFESTKMKDVWSAAVQNKLTISDNFTISSIVKKCGYKICYTPDCLVTEEFDIKGSEWLRWIKRQNVNTKINFPQSFYSDFFAVTLPGLIGAAGFFVSVILLLGFKISSPVLIPFLIWPLIHFVYAFLIINSVYPDRKLYPDYKNSMKEKLNLTLCSYLNLLFYFSAVWAIFSSKMVWRNQSCN